MVLCSITYRLLQKQVRELQESSDSTSGLAADALEEAEPFDEISAAGIMDEEQFQIRSLHKVAGKNKA